jgi:hypothetical protein
VFAACESGASRLAFPLSADRAETHTRLIISQTAYASVLIAVLKDD